MEVHCNDYTYSRFRITVTTQLVVTNKEREKHNDTEHI